MQQQQQCGRCRSEFSAPNESSWRRHGANKAENTRLEMTADLREKDQHILKSTSMKQQENPADFSSVHKVQAFFAQICCHFQPCISRFTLRRLRLVDMSSISYQLKCGCGSAVDLPSLSVMCLSRCDEAL